jgi:hypothetical protein
MMTETNTRPRHLICLDIYPPALSLGELTDELHLLRDRTDIYPAGAWICRVGQRILQTELDRREASTEEEPVEHGLPQIDMAKPTPSDIAFAIGIINERTRASVPERVGKMLDPDCQW